MGSAAPRSPSCPTSGSQPVSLRRPSRSAVRQTILSCYFAEPTRAQPVRRDSFGTRDTVLARGRDVVRSDVVRTSFIDESVPRPVRDAQSGWHVICGSVIAGHRGGGRPREVVVRHLSEPIVAGEADVCQCLIEAADCSTVHLLVRAVTAVPVSYTHLRAHETPEHLVCRL